MLPDQGKFWEQFHGCTFGCNIISNQDTFFSSLTRALELSKGHTQQQQKAGKGISAFLFLAKIPVSCKLAKSVCFGKQQVYQTFWQSPGEMTVQWCWKENYQREISVSDSISLCSALKKNKGPFSILNLLLVSINLCQEGCKCCRFRKMGDHCYLAPALCTPQSAKVF